jgi:outer membrane receptor protein involved in Fe transport
MFTRKKLHTAIVSGLACGVLASAAAPVYAQDEDVESAENLMLEEVYVTARKRQELVVEIPMNIAVVGAAEIEARNLTTTDDIYRTIAGGANPRGELILRGLSGSNDSTPGTTSVFTDGIPFDFAYLYDVERVEVLRGPQGTLWGSNAIGGTVQVITKKPNLNEFEVGGQVLMTTEKNRPGNETRGSFMLNMPIREDELALRLTGSYSNREGKVLNTFTGTSGKESDHFIRAQLMWQPGEDTYVNLSLINTNEFTSTRTYADRSQPEYYYEAVLTENPDATYGYDVYLDFPSCPPGVERTACRGGQLNGHDPKFAVWELMDPFEEWETNLIGLNVEKDDIFSGVDFTYSGSFRTGHYDGRQAAWSRLDAQDMFRTWIIDKDTDADSGDRWTHELRFQSNTDGPFQWTAGFFYDEFKGHVEPNAQWQYHASDNKSRAIAAYLWGYYWGLGDPTQIGIDMYGDGTKNYNYAVHKWVTEEKALFGETSYTFDLDNGYLMELTAGIRFYDLQADLHDENSGIWIGPEPAPSISQGGEDGERIKLGLNYMPNDAVSVFGIYSEGYRPGGNNGPSAPNACADDENIGSYVNRYESDTIENYEIGFKGFLFDRRVQFTSAIYQIDWTGVQADVYMPSCGFTYTANAASAESKGIEFESTSRLTDNLKLIVNAAYTKSEMTSDVPSLGAKAGDEMTMVPEYNFYVALDMDTQFFGRPGSWRLDMEGYGETKSHFNVKDADIAPAYEIVNLAASVQLNENVSLGLHVKNLLDDEVILYKRSRYRGDWSTGAQNYWYGDERNLSIRLDFNY